MGDQQPTGNALLELREVHLVYRALPAIQHIDWRLEKGQQWACLGPNGAGKTSLARVISRQATHFSGDVLRSPELEENGVAYVCFEQARALCERDKKLDDSEYRADASDPGTRVRDIILDGRPAGSSFERWVERLGIGRILERGLRFISTGEMRKTLLIKAILSEPALLILDSPLDGLDLSTQEEMREVLNELLHSPICVLMLCRQLEDVPDAVSHLLVMDEGRIRTCGPGGLVRDDPGVQALMNPPLATLAALPPLCSDRRQLHRRYRRPGWSRRLPRLGRSPCRAHCAGPGLTALCESRNPGPPHAPDSPRAAGSGSGNASRSGNLFQRHFS